MPETAHIASTEAIESFKSVLIVYLEKGRRVLDDMHETVTETRSWLENDRRLYWKHQVREREKAVRSEKQALLAIRLSSFREPEERQNAVVRKAERSLREAREKLRLVERWIRQYDRSVEYVAKPITGLREVLEHDMHKAVIFLGHTIETLAAYTADVQPGGSAGSAENTPKQQKQGKTGESDER